MVQEKLIEEKDEFVESLNLTSERIKKDFESVKCIEGFPKGEDEDILDLSNPPYYTAYPNPYIKDFIEYYGTPYDEETDDYDVKPYVGDVSEGKNDKIYTAHSYHTKVPPKAIEKFIEHYTKPGDIILDGFCGSGMTGVASHLSSRKAILIDLSPSATFLSYNYNSEIDLSEFKNEINNIFVELKNKCGWMFETKHENNLKGEINYTVWCDKLKCPFCENSYDYWDLAVDLENGIIKKEYECPHCNAIINNKNSPKFKKEVYDKCMDKYIEQAIQSPSYISYFFNNERFTKKPDNEDLELIKNINSLEIPYWFPTNELPWGFNTKQPINSHGFTNVHHFYSYRNLIVLSTIYDLISKSKLKKHLMVLMTSVLNRNIYKGNKFIINKYNPYGRINGPLSGTLYIPPLSVEQNGIELMNYKEKTVENMFDFYKKGKTLISSQSSTDLSNIPKNSIDYIFIDPPFGANIMYSELNYLTESWLKVFTNNEDEAIINQFQNKDSNNYFYLISECFKQFYDILKPNRWITIEFHNSKAEIWKIIQNSIIKAGFVIAQVAVLDKKQGTIHQDAKVNGAVKNDLVINAYKPSAEFSTRFLQKAGNNLEFDFVKMHLEKLPIEPNIERSQHMLYSKLLAQYIQNGFEINMDAIEFYELLSDNFAERDNCWFTFEQASQYEEAMKLKSNLDGIDLGNSILGIDDEKSAIVWLAQFLTEPKSYAEIYENYIKNLLTSQDNIPELKNILDENFVSEDNKYRLPTNIERTYKEERRNKQLQKEFNNLLEEINSSKKKIKEVRKEALSYGLMKLYKEKDVDLIKTIGNRVDRSIIDSDDDISTIIDWAMYK